MPISRREARVRGALANMEAERQRNLAWLKSTNLRRLRAERRAWLDECLRCGCGGAPSPKHGGKAYPYHELDCMAIDGFDSQIGKSFFLLEDMED